ncbi:MAG: hypothetical protein FWC26_02980, partial [Fibromonadales bacterium]|nr:hypothetical protein [Fibromonadales bacterium]
AGWIDIIDITDMNANLSHVANSHTAYKYKRNDKESYYIEARRKTGRSSPIPGEGLVVWQVHTGGKNTEVDSKNPFPLVKVIQANNVNSTAQAFVSGVGANAPFRSGGGSRNTSFSNITQPAALYYDGTPSDINISEVSAAGDTMTFKIGTFIDLPSSSSVVPSSSSSDAPSSSSSDAPSSSSSDVPSSSSSDAPSPSSSSSEEATLIHASALKNLPQGANAEIYNLQGKRVTVLKKGVYIIKVSGKILRVAVW